MKKIGFFFGAVLLISGCASGSIDGGNDISGKPKSATQIIIIGAGISGLAAAKTLKENGLTVTVLEGRDRIGGRVWTDRSIPGESLDMGASWIHGVDGNPCCG